MDMILVDQLNDLLNNDRNQLKQDNVKEIINKLVSKRDNLKENFVLNLPFNYNNEKEFSEFFQRMDMLTKELGDLKSDRTAILEKLKSQEGDNKSSIEIELSPLVLKSIHIKRQLSYIKCMISVEELKFECFNKSI